VKQTSLKNRRQSQSKPVIAENRFYVNFKSPQTTRKLVSKWGRLLSAGRWSSFPENSFLCCQSRGPAGGGGYRQGKMEKIKNVEKGRELYRRGLARLSVPHQKGLLEGKLSDDLERKSTAWLSGGSTIADLKSLPGSEGEKKESEVSSKQQQLRSKLCLPDNKRPRNALRGKNWRNDPRKSRKKPCRAAKRLSRRALGETRLKARIGKTRRPQGEFAQGYLRKKRRGSSSLSGYTIQGRTKLCNRHERHCKSQGLKKKPKRRRAAGPATADATAVRFCFNRPRKKTIQREKRS